MKFTIAVVMMALAVSAQAGYAPIAPLAYSLPYAAPYQYAPLSYTARSYPLAYAAAPTYAAAPAFYNYEYAPAIRAYPEINTYAELRSPATIVPVAAEGTYTAINKGAVHVAPLPGHSLSASSVNLESAPGTY
ncbi:adult cuticle protein 1-like [Bradysia coprophila]|uniref:adult cuticle protein 1-like n=1 Tax=Bradysia coprophila TaxID=38358 RepID=UPI00187D8C36|nr:adult cuticle protein 1-like [Bradysia coprophila]